MGFVIETAVWAQYSIVTVDSFLAMCRNIPLLKAWWKTKVSGVGKRYEFVEVLAECVTLILDCELDHVDVGDFKCPIAVKGTLLSLLEAWDELKDEFVSIMVEETAKKLMEYWVKFLISAKTLKCLICGQ